MALAPRTDLAMNLFELIESSNTNWVIRHSYTLWDFYARASMESPGRRDVGRQRFAQWLKSRAPDEPIFPAIMKAKILGQIEFRWWPGAEE